MRFVQVLSYFTANLKIVPVKKYCLLFMMSTSFLYCASQQTLNYKHLTISFPFNFSTMVLKGITVNYLNKDSVSYQADAVNDTSFTVKTQKDLDEFLGGRGIVKKTSMGSDFNTEISDTSIGGARGKYLHLYSPTLQHKSKEVFAFLTILANQSYQVIAAIYGGIDETSRMRIKKFFESMKFQGSQLSPG